MSNFRFDRLTKDQSMNPDLKEYEIPPVSGNPKEINCARVKNGMLSFGWTDILTPFYRACGGAHFWRTFHGKPVMIRFPDLKKNIAGWHYGPVEWIF